MVVEVAVVACLSCGVALSLFMRAADHAIYYSIIAFYGFSLSFSWAHDLVRHARKCQEVPGTTGNMSRIAV